MTDIKHFDVVIVGGGFSGLMAAYRLKQNGIQNILVLEQGKEIKDRKCFANQERGCVKCSQCSIINGVSGSGIFSDSKYSFMSAGAEGHVGGVLGETKYLGRDILDKYIQEVLTTLKNFGKECKGIEQFSSNKELVNLCAHFGLQMFETEVVHFGSENGYIIMNNMVRWLRSNGVIIQSNCKVKDINIKEKIIMCQNNMTYKADKIIISVGRSGANFVRELCEKNNIGFTVGGVDIGVRVELKADIWDHITNKIYEPKIYYKNVRMFCPNPHGFLSSERCEGIVTVNGYGLAEKKSPNTNFALMHNLELTQPFNDPTLYARNVAELTNLLGGGTALIQRFGDLKNNKRSTKEKIRNNSVQSTLGGCYAGDLSLAIPKKILDRIIETIFVLDKIAPGTADDDTLIVGTEIKTNSLKPNLDKNFQIIEGVYLIGDGSSLTKGLSQSGAHSFYVSDIIVDNKEVLSKCKKD